MNAYEGGSVKQRKTNYLRSDGYLKVENGVYHTPHYRTKKTEQSKKANLTRSESRRVTSLKDVLRGITFLCQRVKTNLRANTKILAAWSVQKASVYASIAMSDTRNKTLRTA
jgi:hypothetical protein